MFRLRRWEILVDFLGNARNLDPSKSSPRQSFNAPCAVLRLPSSFFPKFGLYMVYIYMIIKYLTKAIFWGVIDTRFKPIKSFIYVLACLPNIVKETPTASNSINYIRMTIQINRTRVRFKDSWFVFHDSCWSFHESHFSRKLVFLESHGKQNTGLWS